MLRIWSVCFAVLFTGACIACSGTGTNAPGSTARQSEREEEADRQREAEEQKKKIEALKLEIKRLEGITLIKYERATDEMSYKDVCTVLGSEGEEKFRTDVGGETRITYVWKNVDNSMITATFRNGKLVSKSHVGLK